MSIAEFKEIWRRSIYYRSHGEIKHKIEFICGFMLCGKRDAAALIPYLDGVEV